MKNLPVAQEPQETRVRSLGWEDYLKDAMATHSSILVLFDSFATPWTVVSQAPLSMGFPRQEYWSGLLFPSPGHLPHPGIEPDLLIASGLLQCWGFFTSEPAGKPLCTILGWLKSTSSCNDRGFHQWSRPQ